MGVKRKSAPYAGTEVPPERSKQQIEKLLREYGADGVQWSEIWAQNKSTLSFIFGIDNDRKILVRLEPPAFAQKRRTWNPAQGRYEQVDSPNWAQSYRLLYAYLKAKLESIAYGLRDVEEEFLSDLVVRDRMGREATVKELYQQQLGSGELRPALGAGSEPAPKTRANVIEVQPEEAS
jgi:hypothetical protein